MATKNQTCLHCGKELTRQQVWRNCKYCSRKCFADGHWGEATQFGKKKVRSKKFIEAVRLCQSDLRQVDVARLLGVHPQTISNWFRDHGVILSERECKHCGKPIVGAKNLSNRKYCTKSCSNKASYARNHPEGQQRRFDPDLRARALEMYWGGLQGRAIAEYLGLPDGTLRSWIHDFGYLRKRRRDARFMKLLPVNLRIEIAASPKEWQHILREYAPGSDSLPVHLVCGTRHGKGEINHLAAIVSDILKRDPRDGEIYAFCNREREQITCICWRRGAFFLTKMPKAQGEYIWPEASIGLRIEVCQNEFEFLLSLSKKRGGKPYFA